MPTPMDLGYRMPAEWEPVEAVWMSWPIAAHLWGGIPREEVEQVFVDLAATISRYAAVRVNVGPEHQERIARLLGASATVYAIETDDVWCRDHGPTFLKNDQSGAAALVDWVYNAWGGKFLYEKDARVARAVAAEAGVPLFASQLICEGGALESNGAGRILTTKSVLLNENRNPAWSQEEVTAELRAMLGAKEVIWLPAGLEHDDTDGHIDMVARFVGPHEVLAVEPVTAALEANLQLLQSAGLEVRCLPAVGEFSEGVEGSYANFLIVNEGVIVPQYGLPQDSRALALMQEVFPQKEIVPFDCSLLGLEGGAVHCLTQGQFR